MTPHCPFESLRSAFGSLLLTAGVLLGLGGAAAAQTTAPVTAIKTTGQTLFTTQVPVRMSAGAYELGLSVVPDVAGQITAVRFWKVFGETGIHTGRVWSASGQLLASVVFSNETLSGWQEQALDSPLPTLGNTPYVISVNANDVWAATESFFSAALTNGDLQAPAGTSGVYGTVDAFPRATYQSYNYFRDVVFVPDPAQPTRSLALSGKLAFGTVTPNTTATAVLTIGNGGTVPLTVSGISYPAGFSGDWAGGTIEAGASHDVTVTFAPTWLTAYGGPITVTADQTSGVNTIAASGAGVPSQTLLTTQMPAGTWSSNYELGAIVVPDIAGQITAVRFWKALGETGIHTGRVWTAGGQVLASVVFVNETESGWQEQVLPAPLPTLANTPYVISVNANELWAGTDSFFTAPLTNAHLQGPAGNGGVFGAAGMFPDGVYQSYNYFRDVVFVPDLGQPTRVLALSGDLTFGTLAADTTATRILSIGNSGTAPLTVSGISFPAGFSGDWTSGTIAPGESHDVIVTFAPTATLTYDGTITVTAHRTKGVNTVAASGAGLAPTPPPPPPPPPPTPTSVLALSGDLAFGTVAANMFATRILVIGNGGTAPLTVSGISFPTGFSGDWTAGTIAPGGLHEVTVVFAPTATSTYGGTITVTADQTSGVNTITASGAGLAPVPPPTPTRVLALSGDLAFGTVAANIIATRIFAIGNGGTAPLTVSGISFPAGFSGDWTAGTIPPGGSHDVIVTFAPTATATYGGTITVTADQTSGVTTVAASGAGLAPVPPPTPTRILALSGDLAFGTVAAKMFATRLLVIFNGGTAPLTVSGISFPAAFSGDWTAGTIAPGDSREVTVTFAPLATATYDGTITVTADQTSGVNTVTASGAGLKPVPPPTRILALTGDLAFGAVTANTTATRILAIGNSGTATLTVSGISFPAGFSGDWANGTIAPGDSHNVTVTFAPTATATYGGTITVTADQTSGVTTVAASGAGLAPPPPPAPTRVLTLTGDLAFGTVTANATATRILAISNGGTAPLTVSGISFPAGFSGDWTNGTIAPGDSHNVTVMFAPTVTRSYGGTITVTADQTSGVNTVAASGAGLSTLQSQTLLTTQLPTSTSAGYYEMGLRVVPDVTGRITAVRFWKADGEIGTHTGRIWSDSGQLLASVVFVNESASGWQEQTLAAPLPTLANTPYVVSVNTNVVWAGTKSFFNVPLINGYLLGQAGKAGVYGAIGNFPTVAYQAYNYFRDLVFLPDPGQTTRLLSLSGDLSFGMVTANTTATRILTIGNNGTAPLTVIGLIFPPGFSGDWTAGTIAPGDTHDVTVTFAPTSTTTYQGEIAIAGDQTNLVDSIDVSGTGSDGTNLGPTQERANSYDKAWKTGWVNHARALLTKSDKTDGFVLQLGDSITHSMAYAAWPRQGLGKTTEDAQTTDWLHASWWGNGNQDVANKNGWYLADADTTSQRGLTSSSGLSITEFLRGCCNDDGPVMPAVSDAATAQALLTSTSFQGNLQVDTVLSAFKDAQFAVLMLGTNDAINADNAAELATLVDKLEALHIVPILSTVPPGYGSVPNEVEPPLNAAVRALAQARNLPLIDFYREIVLRRPGTTWAGTLISDDGIHPTGSGAGFAADSDPYSPGGDAFTHTTGDALLNVGYLLRSWLTVQKIEEVKRFVIDGVNPP